MNFFGGRKGSAGKQPGLTVGHKTPKSHGDKPLPAIKNCIDQKIRPESQYRIPLKDAPASENGAERRNARRRRGRWGKWDYRRRCKAAFRGLCHCLFPGDVTGWINPEEDVFFRNVRPGIQNGEIVLPISGSGKTALSIPVPDEKFPAVFTSCGFLKGHPVFPVHHRNPQGALHTGSIRKISRKNMEFIPCDQIGCLDKSAESPERLPENPVDP